MKKLIAIILLSLTSTYSADIPSIYEVPVEDENLKEYSFYDIDPSVYEVIDGQVVFDYALPKYLVGEKLGRIKFEGTDSSDLRNEFGRADCSQNSCEIVYNSKMEDLLAQNLADVEDLIIRDFPAVDADRLIQIARDFSGEPIGIVHFVDADKY